jgi:hypothetical protein
MTKLSDKIKTALDESRILILGTQILLGFHYRGVFESGFEALPRVSQYIKLAGLGVLLIAIILIIWPSAYHRIVYQGNDHPKVHDFITTVMDIALFPIVIALALDFYVKRKTVRHDGRNDRRNGNRIRWAFLPVRLGLTQHAAS